MLRFTLSLFFLTSIYANAQQPKLVLPVQAGHSNEINSAVFSPDGKKILTASSDNLALLWDAVTGTVIASFNAHTFFVNSANFSPDGKKIVTASGDGKAVLWNAETGDSVYSIQLNKYGIEYAEFSPDGKLIVLALSDVMAVVWDVNKRTVLHLLQGHQSIIRSARFSRDGKRIVTGAEDRTAIVWDVNTGKTIFTLTHNFSIKDADFDPAGKIISTTAAYDSIVCIWNAATGTLIAELIHPEIVNNANFSPDGTRLVTSCWDKYARVWDTKSGREIKRLKEHSNIIECAYYDKSGNRIFTTDGNNIVISNALTGEVETLYPVPSYMEIAKKITVSPDGKKILVAFGDFSVKMIDVENNKQVSDLSGYAYKINSARFSPDGKKVVTSSDDLSAYIWDISSGKIVQNLEGHKFNVKSASFSSDGKKIITTSWDKQAAIWDAETGKLLKAFLHNSLINDGVFSTDGNRIATAGNDGEVSVWNSVTDSLLFSYSDSNCSIGLIQFNNDGSKILTSCLWGNSLKLWDGYSGNLVFDFNKNDKSIKAGSFSFDGKKVIVSTGNLPSVIKIFDLNSGTLTDSLKGHGSFINTILLTPDETKIITDSWDNFIYIIDRRSGLLLHKLKAHTNRISSVSISPDGKHMVSVGEDNTCKLWDIDKGEILYTFFSVKGSEYMVVDSLNRYDGTEEARKLVYLLCGTEVLLLDQVKGELWVPNLAERIMKGETIHAKKLDELEICGLTPEVSNASLNESEYRFRIRPRRGGLGETILYINGIELKRYRKQQLKNISGLYELLVNKSEIKKFFVPGEENHVSIKALTADNLISSRSEVIDEQADSVNRTPPNLYAVVVGVSDYKDDHLDLRYAAKDAQDIANTLETAAQKLLNTDGKQHVFIQRIHTGEGRDQFPEKKAIQQALSDIGKKSKPNDVLLVFFAGHGKMNEKTKQFHFLTAEATAGMDAYALPGASISSEELFEWMKPNNINVKKRILIFDACHSGQLNNDVVKVGSEGQGYMTARGDEQTEKIRAIEKMNEKSGLFILSASGSDQKAYEISGLEQGVLTYSLLHAIKEQPEILNDQKYLDLSRWFNAAERTVGEIMKKFKSSQQAQIVSTTNFEIGVVDDEVRRKIILPQEKFLFTSSEFRHTRLRYDTLQLRSLIDKELGQLAAGNNTIPLLFNTAYTGADIYSIAGDYDITGTNIRVYIMVLKGGVPAGIQLTINGETSKIQELAAEITRQVLDRLQNSK